jgi:hypothetical protein
VRVRVGVRVSRDDGGRKIEVEIEIETGRGNTRDRLT